jgi:ribonuclease HII
MTKVFIAGIDEAGRGPVIGPMVMALVAVEEHMDFEFRTLGIADSKILSPIRRKELAEVIRREGLVETRIVSAQEIDQAIKDPSSNLNILEAQVAGELINRMTKRLGTSLKHVILDCPSSNRVSYVSLMRTFVKGDVKLIAEHKADAKYPTVSAASIIAKVMRDEEIEKLKKLHNVDFGSGYPGDEKTASFVRKHHADYDFFRTTWETYKRVVASKAQQTLNGFVPKPLLSTDVENKKKMLESLGLEQTETKGSSEVLRLKGEGVTITLYTTGKILFQGKEKEYYERLYNKR